MLGIAIVSHVPEIAVGVKKLISQVSGNTPITIAGGTNEGNIGTSMEKIKDAFLDNQANEILAFYDLGSAKMNLELAKEFCEKKIHIYDVALVEGAYIAASLIPTGEKIDKIEHQLSQVELKK